MTIWAEFEKQTHINPDYFLGMVLKFIYPYNDLECLIGYGDESWTRCLDENGRITAMIHMDDNELKITREKI